MNTNNVRTYIGQENGHVTAAKAAHVSWIVLVAYKNVVKVENDATFLSIGTYTSFSYKSINNESGVFLPELWNIWYFWVACL